MMAIPYARVAARDILCASGEPVWPVCNEGELVALRRAVEIANGSLEEVTARPATHRGGVGTVAGLGEGVKAAAEMYAHLTGRAFTTVRELKVLTKTPDLEVVVALEADVGPELLDVLYRRRRSASAPGIVMGYDAESLWKQVLARSALATIDMDLSTPRWYEIHPFLDLPTLRTQDGALLTRQAELAEVRAALAARAGLLRVVTHGNGVDAPFHPQLVICPMREDPPWEDGELAPGCYYTGVCGRKQRRLEDVGADEVLSPRELAARVLLLDTCWGMYPWLGLVHRSWSMARRILDGFRVGALLTSWQLSFIGPATSFRLARGIADGLPLGVALARHHKLTRGQGQDHCLCLLGDPKMRLPERSSPSREGAFRAIFAFISDVHRDAPVEAMGFVRAFIRQAELEGPANAKSALESLERALAEDERSPRADATSSGSTAALGPEVRDAAIQYIIDSGSVPSKIWGSLASAPRLTNERQICWICGGMASEHIATMRIPELPPRRLTVCPRCGLTEDSPANRRLSLCVRENGEFRLVGEVPRENWTAALMLEPVGSPVAWRWPSDDGGVPGPFRPPGPWPAGPFRAVAIIVWGDGEFAVVGGHARAEGTGLNVRIRTH